MKETLKVIGLTIVLLYIAFDSFMFLSIFGFNVVRNVLAAIGTFYVLRPAYRWVRRLP